MTIHVQPSLLRRQLAPPAKPWVWTTVLWTAIVFVLPMYRALPGSIKVLWFAAALGLIVGSVVLLRVAAPLFGSIWIFAGFASLVAVVTATNTGSIPENLYNGGQLLVVLGLGVFVMTANVRWAPRFVESVSLAFLAGQTISSLAGIVQITGRPVFGFETVEGRASGLALHPNTLGLMSTVAVILCVSMLLRGNGGRVILITLTIVNIGGLMSTGSLSSLLAAALGVAVTLLAMRDRIKHLVGILVAIGVVLWLVSTFTSITDSIRSPADRYLQVTGQTGAASTWEIRQHTYDFAWSRIKEQPFFGNGLAAEHGGTFNGTTVTHNIFLRAWFQGGILLAISIALIIAAVLVVAIRSIARKKDGGAAGILVALMGFALTSAFFEQPDYWIPAIIAWAAISVNNAQAVASANSQRTVQPT